MNVEVGDRVEQDMFRLSMHPNRRITDRKELKLNQKRPLSGTVIRVVGDRALVRWDSRAVEWSAIHLLSKA